MAEVKSQTTSGWSRLWLYLFATAAWFLIFIFSVTLSPDRLDVQLTLTLTVAVLLVTFMIYCDKCLTAFQKRFESMIAKRPLHRGWMVRYTYYLLGILCFFFIFLMGVVMSPNRMDAELILTLIIAVLLIVFMLNTSQTLMALHKKLDGMTSGK